MLARNLLAHGHCLHFTARRCVNTTEKPRSRRREETLIKDRESGPPTGPRRQQQRPSIAMLPLKTRQETRSRCRRGAIGVPPRTADIPVRSRPRRPTALDQPNPIRTRHKCPRSGLVIKGQLRRSGMVIGTQAFRGISSVRSAMELNVPHSARHRLQAHAETCRSYGASPARYCCHRRNEVRAFLRRVLGELPSALDDEKAKGVRSRRHSSMGKQIPKRIDAEPRRPKARRMTEDQSTPK
jgi:hypothetical protein